MQRRLQRAIYRITAEALKAAGGGGAPEACPTDRATDSDSETYSEQWRRLNGVASGCMLPDLQVTNVT